MSRRFSFLWLAAAIVFLSAPIAVHANEAIDLDLSRGNVNATWQGIGEITMQQLETGIVLTTTGTGTFLTSTDLPFLPEAASIITSSNTNTPVYFVWIFKNDPEQRNFTIPLAIPAGQNKVTQFPLSIHSSWQEGPKGFGIVLPPNTTIVLHKMVLAKWTPLEHMAEAWKSLWTLDTYSPYSINFLWGPRFAWNPVTRSTLYWPSFPQISATYALYWTMLILVIGCVLLWRKNAAKMLKAIALVIIGAWILFDFRMGIEFLSWIKTDYTQYISASPSTRTFRDRGHFYDFAAFTAPLVADRASYVFLASEQWPYLGNIRYLTYPAIPGLDAEADDTWVIYDRPDIEVSGAGQLIIDGQAVSNPGDVLGRFDSSSFVFRVRTIPQ